MFLVCAVSVHAQQPQSDSPAVTAEQQKAFKEVVLVAEKAKAELDAAQLRLDAAQARAQATLYQIMALLKISPSEYKAVLSDAGELRFEQLKTPEPVKKE
jgi:hypothetical protein